MRREEKNKKKVLGSSQDDGLLLHSHWRAISDLAAVKVGLLLLLLSEEDTSVLWRTPEGDESSLGGLSRVLPTSPQLPISSRSDSFTPRPTKTLIHGQVPGKHNRKGQTKKMHVWGHHQLRHLLVLDKHNRKGQKKGEGYINALPKL